MDDFSCKNGLLSGTEGAKTAVGHYAVALAGHDRGKIYFVVGVSGETGTRGDILLCNGKSRPLGKPKRKKRMHVQILRKRDDEIAGELLAGRAPDDSVIIRKLREFGRNHDCD